MVYSNALYFASHFDKLTKEVLSNFNEKQKSQKNISPDKITLEKVCLDYVKMDILKNLARTHRRRDTKYPTRDGDNNPICRDPNCKDCN
ncbi:MAG: hypothetical protein OEL52_00320 [Nitrosopumilus sp.]|nr:hypothetical protein [Nitrosopumilus sp.]